MRSSRRGSWATPYLYLLPAVLVLGVFFVVPSVQVAYYSLTSYSVFEDPRWTGLGNYRRLWSSGWFWVSLGNSAMYLLVTPVLIVLSLVSASVVHAGLRGERVLRLLLFLPVITPTIVGAIAWRVLLREDDGLLNAGLRGVLGVSVPWLTEKPWTLISPMLVTLWKGFGFYMMIFLAGLVSVPKELSEAASLDGAGRVGVARHVVLPSIAPLIALVTVISSISALKVFDEIFVTVQGLPADHKTAVPMVYQKAFVEGEFGLACAQGMVLFAVILGLSLVNLRLSRGRGS
jgi:putative chitobiose transport system permease protein